MAKTVYEELTEATKVVPQDNEDEQSFLRRLADSVNDIEESDFEEMTEATQEWFNDACIAVKNHNPISPLPGYTHEGAEPEEAEEAAPAAKKPEPPKVGGKPANKTKVATKANGSDKPAAEPAKATAGSKTTAKTKDAGKKKSAAKPAVEKKSTVKTPAEAKTKRIPVRKQGGADGSLRKLLVQIHKDPTMSTADLKAATEKANPGHKVKDANATGIRQQYRRIVAFLQTEGVAKEIKLD